MTPTRVLRLVGRLIALIVLVASGIYLLVYLYRWEWNRALVAGLFFVSAEVALLGGLILGRMRAIEERLADRPPGGPGDDALRALREERPPRRSPFAWLEPDDDQKAVFIPVLLGAGVILSGLAYLVERAARATAVPVAEHDLARRLRSLAPPGGGLVPQSAGFDPDDLDLDDTGGEAASGNWRRVAAWSGFVVLVAVAAIGIPLVRDATMSRPAPAVEDQALVVYLEVETREAFDSALQTAEALAVACQVRLPKEVSTVEITQVAPDTARIVLHPALGGTDQRRYEGCLQDATIDRVNAAVGQVETVAEGTVLDDGD